MAFNPSPKVADCRDIAKKWNKCEFRPKLDTDSSATWTVIPTEAGQRFQGKLDSWKR